MNGGFKKCNSSKLSNSAKQIETLENYTIM